MIPLCLLQYLLTPALPAPTLAITVAPSETLTVRVTGQGRRLVIPSVFGTAKNPTGG
jgi:hypothetical protein